MTLSKEELIEMILKQNTKIPIQQASSKFNILIRKSK